MDNSDINAEAREAPSWLWLGLGGLVLALGVSVFFLSTTAGASSRPDETGTPIDIAPLVEVASVEVASDQYAVSAPGRLQPRQTVQVVGEVPGKVSYLNPNLETGGRFAEGDVLFRIDRTDYTAAVSQAEAALAAAEANLSRARADLTRQEELAERGFAPDSVLDGAVAALASAEATVDQSRAQLAVARQNLARTSVRAPFPAIVLSENLAPDSYIAPGAPVAELLDASAGEVIAGLSPTDVGAVRRALANLDLTGEPLTVLARPNEGSLGTRTLEGTLVSFAPEIDTLSRTVSIRAVFPTAFAPENEGLVFAGDFVTLEIEGVASEPLYQVPSAAVRRNSQIWAVQDDDHIRAIAVTPVDIGTKSSLVMSSESLAGQRVMITSLPEEVEGMRVRVATETAAREQD